MNESPPSDPSNPPRHPIANRQSGARLFFIVFAAVLAALLVGAALLRVYLFPKQLKPVELSARETQHLNGKLQALGMTPQRDDSANEPLEPEPYSEAGAKREVEFSERELNALLASNTDMADRLAIDLSNDLASAKLLIPLEPDFPVLGGRTLRINAGVAIAYREGRPSVTLRGVSFGGVPIPNAWLGNLKNVDLVEEFGGAPGFWQSFTEGVEFIEIREGRLHVKLKE